jgi:hypothetical protein
MNPFKPNPQTLKTTSHLHTAKSTTIATIHVIAVNDCSWVLLHSPHGARRQVCVHDVDLSRSALGVERLEFGASQHSVLDFVHA